jgi:hypothetical protein
MHDVVVENSQDLSVPETKYAMKIVLNRDQFSARLTEGTDAGVNGTPAFSLAQAGQEKRSQRGSAISIFRTLMVGQVEEDQD